MKLCANLQCNKQFNSKYVCQIYCSNKCCIFMQDKEKPCWNTNLSIEDPKIIRWVSVYTNSSIEAITELAKLKYIKIKEVERFTELFKYENP